MDRAAVGLVLGFLLLPALVLPDPTAPAAAAALLALVALVAWLPASPARAALVRVVAAPPDQATPLLLASRVTDPVHHPRRPRAPGHA